VARAADHAAAYLHPLARSTQVKHILGAAAHAVRAAELAAGGDRSVGAQRIEWACQRASHACSCCGAQAPPRRSDERESCGRTLERVGHLTAIVLRRSQSIPGETCASDLRLDDCRGPVGPGLHAAEQIRRGDGPGRTPGNVNWLQRDRLAFPRRLFGSVTSRTRQHSAYDPLRAAS
jgi:hypothetical protein